MVKSGLEDKNGKSLKIVEDHITEITKVRPKKPDLAKKCKKSW